jgi:hypothetical protein
VTSVTIGDGATSIGEEAFVNCFSLTNVSIPDSVTSIATNAFSGCSRLSNIVIPNRLTTLQAGVFSSCMSLTSVTIPASVTRVEQGAFSGCFNLLAVYFKGNAPSVDSSAFERDDNVTVYYLPGTGAWDSTVGGRPTVLWNPFILASGPGLGGQSNGFGFNITGTADIPVVLEATTSLGSGGWVVLASFNLINGSVYFNDPDWTNYPARMYRLRSP